MYPTLRGRKRGASHVVLLTLVVIVLLLISSVALTKKNKTRNPVAIGVVTDLSGIASYWGTSTVIGANLAKDDLASKGYNIDVKFEDYQFAAPQALSAATKLVTQDNVGAVYAEFNPAAYAIAPYIKDKDVLFVYDAAPVSPLAESDHIFKTYLDYEVGCQLVAQKFKDAGITKVGSLKPNLEPGDLCEKGVKTVYGDSVVSESFDLGETDFKARLLKMNQQGAGAVVSVVFEGDALNILKTIKEQGLPLKVGFTDDAVTTQVVDQYGDQLKGGYGFGFRDVDAGFKDRVKAANNDVEPASYYAAALAYTHVTQLADALGQCGVDIACSTSKMADSRADSKIGFKNFSNQIATIDTLIKSY